MTYFILTRLLPTFVLTFFAFALIRTQIFGSLKKRSFFHRELLLYLFAAYVMTCLVSVLTPGTSLESQGIVVGGEQSGLVNTALVRIQTGQGINLRPFYTIFNFHRYGRGMASFLNLWGNIFLFIPYAFGLLLLFKRFKNFKSFFRLILTTTLSIEFLQLFVNRSVDIDDVILNLLGALIGYLIYQVLAKPLALKRFAR